MERSSRAGMWRGWDLNPQSLHVTVMVCCFSWDTRGCWPPTCGAHPVLSFLFSRASTRPTARDGILEQRWGGPGPGQTRDATLVLRATRWWHCGELLSSLSLSFLSFSMRVVRAQA